MAFVSLKAWRARSSEKAALAAGLKVDLRTALALGEADSVHLNEIACPDPGCPDLETVILVMRDTEPTRAFRIRRTLDAILPTDLSLIAQDERRRRESGTVEGPALD